MKNKIAIYIIYWRQYAIYMQAKIYRPLIMLENVYKRIKEVNAASLRTLEINLGRSARALNEARE